MKSRKIKMGRSWSPCRVVAACASVIALATPAYAQNDPLQEGDRVMAALGGNDFFGMRIVRCPAGQQIAGFDLALGKEIVGGSLLMSGTEISIVNAIQPICVRALAPAVVSPFEPRSSPMAGQGSSSVRLVCPRDTPVVTKMKIQVSDKRHLTEQVAFFKSLSVNGIQLYCGLADVAPSRHVEGPSYWGPLSGEQPIDANSRCADGLVAVGINVQAADLRQVLALGLVCGTPVLTPGPVVRAQGRVRVETPGAVASHWTRPVCDVAKEARARNSPAAPGLEAKCAAQPAPVPIDHDGLVAKGEAIAGEDPLAVELLDQQPDNGSRLGFGIGMAVAENETAYGPGKQRIHDNLPADEQAGFRAAVDFSLERNSNAQLAAVGAAIVAANRTVAEVRNAEADVFFRLGFDIASGFFGDPKLGGLGYTATGPGSLGIRKSLSAAGQRGFDAAVAFHFGQNYVR